MKKILITLFIVALAFVACTSADDDEVKVSKDSENKEELLKEDQTTDEEFEEDQTTDEESTTNEDEVLNEVSEVVANVDYLNTLSMYQDGLANVFSDFAQLNFEAADNPYLISNPDWITEAAILLAEMQSYIDKIYALDPPDSHKEMHDIVLKAMDEYQFVVDNYPIAIDTLDFELLDRCTEAMIRGSGYIEEATLMIQ